MGFKDTLMELMNEIDLRIEKLNNFKKDRLYNSDEIHNLQHIKQILLERYSHEIPDELIELKKNDPEFILLNDNQEKVYLKVERKKMLNNIEQMVYLYNVKNERGEFVGESIYKENFQLIQMRVQKKIQTGIIGIQDEKNKEYIEQTDFIKELRKQIKNKDKLINKFLNKLSELFFISIYNLYWLPSSPFMFNQLKLREDSELEKFEYKYKDINKMTIDDWLNVYNTKDYQYGSCYSMGSIEDDLGQIYDMLKTQQLIFKHQGGFGQNFSKLRSKYQKVKSIDCNSTGQISFMKPFNENTELVQLTQNTKRGQNMFVLDIDHPEITDFIDQKTDFDKGYNNLKYQNLSVNLNKRFLDKLFNNEKFETVDPNDPNIKFEYDSRKLWSKLILNQTLHSEPGILNLDTINKDNPLRGIEDITSVNPCVTGDTLVLTNEGLKRQSELKIGMMIWSPMSKKFYPIKETYNNGIKSIYEIKLENGQILKQTPEHKLYVKDKGWVEVKDLTTNDQVYFEVEDLSSKLKKQEYSEEDLMKYWLYGIIVQNGKMVFEREMFRRNNLSFYKLSVEIDKRNSLVVKKLKDWFRKNKICMGVKETKETIIISVEQVDMIKNECYTFLKELFDDFKVYSLSKQVVKVDSNNETKSIERQEMNVNNMKLPEKVFTSHPYLIKQFIGGFFDGLRHERFMFNKQLTVNYHNIDNLRNIQLLLSIIGIRTIVRDTNETQIIFKIETKEKFKDLLNYITQVIIKERIEQLLNNIRINTKYEFDKYEKIEYIKPIKEEVVFDIKVEPDYVWVTNGFLSYDCQEFNGQDKSVCVLGSVNLYQFVNKNYNLNFELLRDSTETLHTFLTLQNFQNEFPIDILTHNTRRFRNTGLGYMGLQSVFLIKEIEYGSKKQYEFFKEIMENITSSVLKNSKKLGSLIGGYDKFEMNKNLYNGKELNEKFNTDRFDENMKYYLLNNDNPDTQIELQEDEKIQNQRMMQVAPTGCRINREGIELEDGIFSYRQIIKDQFDFDITEWETGKYVVFQKYDKNKNKIVWDKIPKEEYVMWYINGIKKYIKQKEIEEGYFISRDKDKEITQVLYLVEPKRFYTLNKPLVVKVDNKKDVQKRIYLNGLSEVRELWSEQRGKISRCSLEHKWLVYDKKDKRFYWKEAKDIEIGDLILSKYGVEKVQEIQIDEDYTYDIEVLNTHVYFTEKGYYSHNSISYLCQISSGVEPIFSLQYERRINPNMQNEYSVTVVDTQLKDYLRYKTDYDVDEVIDELIKNGESKKLSDKKFIKTINNTTVQDKLLMLHISNHFIDMNTSTTFNIQKDIKLDDNELQKFYEMNDSYISKILDEYKQKRFNVDINDIILDDKQQLKQVLNFVKKNLCEDISCENRLDVFYDLVEENKFNRRMLDELKQLKEYQNFLKLLQQVNDFYLLSQLFKIKGTTVYIEGSRTPVLKQIKKKKSSKSNIGSNFVLNIGNKEISLDKKGFIKPRQRPVVIEQLKKTVMFKLDDNKERKIHVEVGFDIDSKEPFEIFFRSTESTKEYTEFLNLQGRLLSTMLRQGISIDDQIKQMKKVKTWENKYYNLSKILQEVVEELININKYKGKKRKDMLEKKESQKDWILTSKGYYIDTEGVKRCPVCGEQIYEKDGCIECLSCGWTQCVDN